MNKQQLAYRIVTGLFILFVLPGAVMNILQPQVLVDMAKILGVPLALMTLVGCWKVLGIMALAAPGFPRLKEFAYAGFFFDLTGAAYLHAAASDWAGVAPPLVIASVGLASYLLRQRALASSSTQQPAPQDAVTT